MKCPDCGKEMDGKDICPQCGKKIEATAENIKVAYKEFPKSEFLEILAKHQKTGADIADASTKEDLEQQKEPSNSVELKSPAAQKKTKSAKSRAHRRKKDIDKQALFFFVAGLLAAFGIVGIYLLVKGFF
jgi:hypothetical protein